MPITYTHQDALRVDWYLCTDCSVAMRGSQTGAHVCASSELGKTTSDDEADRVLAAAQEKIADALEGFRSLGQRQVLQDLLRMTEKRQQAASATRSLAKTERQAGIVQGQVQAEKEHLDFLRQCLNAVEASLEDRGWHA